MLLFAANCYWHCLHSLRQCLCNGMVSVHPVCSILSHLAAACRCGGLLLRARWAGNMDLQQQPPDRAPQQHGVQQHMQAVSCCQLTYKAEHRLVCVILGGYAFSQEEHGVVEQVGSHCSILILTLAVLSTCCSVYINAVVFRSLRHIMSDFCNIQMTLYINSLYICNCTHRFHFPSLVRVEYLKIN